MTIMVNTYSLARQKPAIAPSPMEISGTPRTVGELLSLCALACVQRHNDRLEEGAKAPLSGEAMDAMAEVGRIAFGGDYNGKKADPGAAESFALQAYEDGLFRVLLNGRSLGDAPEPLALREGDVLTFVRLTMLAGRRW